MHRDASAATAAPEEEAAAASSFRCHAAGRACRGRPQLPLPPSPRAVAAASTIDCAVSRGSSKRSRSATRSFISRRSFPVVPKSSIANARRICAWRNAISMSIFAVRVLMIWERGRTRPNGQKEKNSIFIYIFKKFNLNPGLGRRRSQSASRTSMEVWPVKQRELHWKTTR